ncbi:MAG: sensor histidine kinase [Candidatus Zipacnadales bacterium]
MDVYRDAEERLVDPHSFQRESERLGAEVARRRRAQAQQRITTFRLRAALAVADELLACEDSDTLCRRAVELLRERFRLERVAIYLDVGDHLIGTYGTDLRGQTTDERSACYPKNGETLRYLESFTRQRERWSTLITDHIEFREGQAVVVGHGWVVVTPIRAGDQVIGVIYNDAAISGAPLDKSKQDVIALFGSLLGAALRQKEAEDARRASEQRLRILIEHSSDIIAVLDPRGVFTFVSPSVERVLGHRVQSIVGSNCFDFVHPDDLPRLLPVFENRIREPGFGAPIEVRFRDAQGVWRHLEAIGSNPGPGSGVEGLVIVARDVTERVNTERQLTSTVKELKRSNEELEQFAYVASHDLQEPLRMVQSYLDLLQRRYGHLLDERANEFIGFAADGAARMRQLINDLLALSRVGTRGQEFQPTDSGQTLDRVLSDLAPMLREAQAQVSRDDLPVVIADPQQLAQVFQNLISNAVKFRSERPCRVHVSVTRQNGEWVFAVQDNGIGLDPKHYDRIFVLFQRLHSRAQYPGTGIGLALCKKIIERHKGRIWVESRPGEGATFYFTLPMTPLPA